MEYQPIEIEEMINLISKGKKVYVKSPYLSDMYDELDLDYNPDLTWGEIFNIIYKTNFYKKV